MEKLSFVIPCYKSSKTIEKVVDEVIEEVSKLKRYDYEIILVNDFSPDNVFDIIQEMCKKNKRIKGINLAKNFGQHSAIMAGMNHICGEIAVFLDDDGQIPVDELYKLLLKLDEGYDVVYAKYANREYSLFRNISSKINEIMSEILISKPKKLQLSSYFVCKKFIIDEVKQYTNSYPYLYGLVLRTTNKIINVEVKHRERMEGKSGYTLSKLLSLWLNGFTAFSVKPLRIATIMGLIFAIIGFIFGAIVIVNKIVHPEIIAGYSSLMAVLLCLGGMIMIMLGLIGEYVGRIYISINNSPQFVIKEKINIEILEERENE